MESEVLIVEDEKADIAEPTALEGLPDVGLTGTIACTHIISELGLVQVAHVESRLLPPVMVLHEGVPTGPVRIFAGRDLVILSSEIAIPPSLVYDLASSYADWLMKVRAKWLISVGGLPVPNRVDITQPKVFGVASTRSIVSTMKTQQIDVMEEGFVAGVYALLLKECARRGIPALALLAESFPNYPDPGAAASVILSLNRLLSLNIPVSKLLEKAEEIRIGARDLMRQAQSSMGRMGKAVEQEMPVMYR